MPEVVPLRERANLPSTFPLVGNIFLFASAGCALFLVGDRTLGGCRSQLPEMAVWIGEHGSESPWLFVRFHNNLGTGPSRAIDHALNVATVGQGHDQEALTVI